MKNIELTRAGYNDLIRFAEEQNTIAPTFDKGVMALVDKIYDTYIIEDISWVIDELYLGATAFSEIFPVNKNWTCLNQLNAAYAVGDAAKWIARDNLLLSPASPRFEDTKDGSFNLKLRTARIKDISDATFSELFGCLTFHRLPFFHHSQTEREAEYIRDLKTGALAQKVDASFISARALILDLVNQPGLPEIKKQRYAYVVGMMNSVSNLIQSYFSDFPVYVRNRGSVSVAETDFIRSLSRNIRKIINPFKRELARLPIDILDHHPGFDDKTGIIRRIADHTSAAHSDFSRTNADSLGWNKTRRKLYTSSEPHCSAS